MIDEHNNSQTAGSAEPPVFEQVYNRMYNQLVTQVYYMINDFERAQEVVQDVFVRAHRNWGNMNSERQAANYLYIGCRNAIKNEYRNRSRLKSGYGKTVYVAKEHYDYFFEQSQSEEAAFFKNEQQKLVIDCLDKLSPKDKEILLMKEFMGKRYQEIADLLDTTTTVVRGRLHKARQRLKKLILQSEAAHDMPESVETAGKVDTADPV